jgi:hypothetical protein
MVDAARNQKIMKLKLSVGASIKSKVSSRRGLFIIAITAVVLTGAFVLWSKYTWDAYQTNYEGWRTSTLDQARTNLALPVTNDQERQAKFVALKKTSDSIAAAKKSLCTVNVLVGWQRFIDELHNREQKCQTILGNFATFGEKLKVATLHLEDEQTLARIISEAPAKSELAEADWADAAAGWHATVGKVDALAADASFTLTKQAARDATGKIDAAWQELLSAHTAKDKGKYLQAQSSLVQAYSTLGTVTDVDSVQLKALLDPLQSAYNDITR